MRSRASGVARLETSFSDIPPQPFVLCSLFVRLFSLYGRATPDARERIPTTPRAQAASIYHATRAQTARPLPTTFLRRDIALLAGRDIRFDHFGWINHAVKLVLSHEAEL